MKTIETKLPEVHAKERRRQVIRLFQEMEWCNVELLDDWDGADLAELRVILDEDDYERLMLALEPSGRER